MLTRLPLRLLLRLRLPSIRSYLITSLPCTCTTHLHPHHSHSHSFSTFSDRVRGATSKKKKQPKKIHDEKKYTKQPPIEDEIDENQPALSDEPADILADEMDQVDEPDGPRGWPKYEQIQQSITYPYADIPHPFLTSLLDIWLSLNKLYLSEQHQHHPCIVVILRRHISHLLSSQTLTDSLHDLQYLHEWGQKQSPPVHVIGVDVDADAKQSQSSPKQIGSFTIHPDNTPLSQLTSTSTSIPIIPYSPHLHTFATHIHDRYQYISHPHATHLHRISNMMTSGACLMLHTFSYEWKHQQPTLFEDDIVFGLALQRYEREHDIIFTQENIHLQDDAKMENFIKQIMKERQKTQKNVGIKNEEIKDEISLIIPGLAPSVTAATLEQDMNAHGLWLDGCAGANNLTHELPRIRDVAPLQIVTDQVFFAVKVKEMKQQREDEDEDDDNK